MEISERTVGGVTILDIGGRLMFGDGDRMLRDRINVLMHQGQRKLLLNLREVTALDSAGVGILVWKYVTVTRQGGELKLTLRDPDGDLRSSATTDLPGPGPYYACFDETPIRQRDRIVARLDGENLADVTMPRFSASADRVTDVITVWASPSWTSASASRAGSIGSGGPASPCGTAQNVHFRVQTSPRIMNVAVPRPQH